MSAAAAVCIGVSFQVFHWLVEDRVDYIEVTPSVSRLAHARIVSFLLVLLVSFVPFAWLTILGQSRPTA